MPAGAVDVGVGAAAAVGEVASVDAGVGAAVDLSAGTVAAGGDVGVAAGPVSADVGASAAVDLPPAQWMSAWAALSQPLTSRQSIRVSLPRPIFRPAQWTSAPAQASRQSVCPVDVGAGAAVDVPAGTVDVGLDTSVASTDVGAAVGVDAGAGNVSADVGVGPVNVGLDVGTGGVGLDLGLGAHDSGGAAARRARRPARWPQAQLMTVIGRAHRWPLVALTILALTLLLRAAGYLAPFEHSVADARSRLLQREVASDIVLVGIDARSLADLRQWPWPRRYHARLLETIAAAEPRRVFVDVDFSAHTSAEDDGLLEAALAAVRAVADRAACVLSAATKASPARWSTRVRWNACAATRRSAA